MKGCSLFVYCSCYEAVRLLAKCIKLRGRAAHMHVKQQATTLTNKTPWLSDAIIKAYSKAECEPWEYIMVKYHQSRNANWVCAQNESGSWILSCLRFEEQEEKNSNFARKNERVTCLPTLASGKLKGCEVDVRLDMAHLHEKAQHDDQGLENCWNCGIRWKSPVGRRAKFKGRISSLTKTRVHHFNCWYRIEGFLSRCE